MVYDYGYQPAPSHITTILIILGLLKSRGTPQINHDLALKPMVTWGSTIFKNPPFIHFTSRFHGLDIPENLGCQRQSSVGQSVGTG
jgi:hypothetical protein